MPLNSGQLQRCTAVENMLGVWISAKLKQLSNSCQIAIFRCLQQCQIQIRLCHDFNLAAAALTYNGHPALFQSNLLSSALIFVQNSKL